MKFTTTIATTFLALVVRSAVGEMIGCSDIRGCLPPVDISCQEWIDSKFAWQGDCCSFHDVVGDDNVMRCELMVVGYCKWFNSELALQANKPSGLIHVLEKGECPESPYKAISDIDTAQLEETESGTKTTSHLRKGSNAELKKTAAQE